MSYVKNSPVWTDSPSTSSPVNAARLNHIEDGIAAASPAAGFYVPKGWGASWRAALAASGSRLVNVLMFGHSISHGWYSSGQNTAAFTATGIVATQLKSDHGEGGTGFTHVSYWPGEIGVGNRAVYTVTSGSWSTFREGINDYEKSGGGAGAAVSVDGYGRHADIYMVSTASSGHFTYAVDGGSTTDINSGGTSTHAMQKTTVDLGTTGWHTIVISQVSGATINFSGIKFYSATGVCWNNMSLPSRKIEDALYLTGGATGSVLKQTITDFVTPIDLLVVMCAINNTSVPRGQRFVADAVTTSGSQTVTSATAAFLTTDIGAAIISPNLPPGTFMQARGSGTSVTVTQTATASGSSQPLTIMRNADSYATALRKVIKAARATSSSCDVVLLVEHPGKFETTTGVDESFGGLSQAIHGVALETGAAVINYAQLGYDSWDYMNSSSYWGSLASQGPAGSDSIHPSDAGHVWYAGYLKTLLSADYSP